MLWGGWVGGGFGGGFGLYRKGRFLNRRLREVEFICPALKPQTSIMNQTIDG